MPQPEFLNSQYTIGVLDPGLTTGFVILDLPTKEFIAYQLDFNGVCRKLIELGSTHTSNLILISESFRITMQTPKNTQAPWSLELIGVARMISRIWTGRDLTLQDPASAKRFASDDRLRYLEWYKPGMGHANDASRHLLLTLATRGWLTQATLEGLMMH